MQLSPIPIVQKYGGSSLSTLDKVRTVARKIIRSAEGGRPIVVVVSAMGNMTSELIERASALSPTPPARELDVLLSAGERVSMALLAVAIEEAGHRAVSLTGPQSGILTDAEHTDATILDVRPERISQELAAGRIVIVAGYQGLSPAGEVTTLGRGGSDTTAVALAGALGAERCEIYSDVAGVYTADPRLVDEPLHLRRVDAELMTEYALQGARVLHPACIEMARHHGVPVLALSTFGDGVGTRIVTGVGDAGVEYSAAEVDSQAVVGITSRKHRLRLRAEAEGPDGLRETFESLTGRDGVLRASETGGRDLLLDVGDLPNAEAFSDGLRERVGRHATLTSNLASVSVVASPSRTRDLRVRVDSILRDAGASVVSTYHRPRSITCAIDADDRRAGVQALHESLIAGPVGVRA